MPYSNYITILPGTGDRTTALSINGEVNTGRGSRTARFSLDGTGDYSHIHAENDLVVTQSGAEPFITLTPDKDVTQISSSGDTVTYTGTSNLQSISIGTGTLDNCLTSATINGASVTKSQLQSGYTVPGDPGLTAEYNVSFVFEIPANSAGATYTGTIGGNTYTVIQSAAVPTNLSFSANTATVDSDGAIVGDTVSVVADGGLTWEITVSS